MVVVGEERRVAQYREVQRGTEMYKEVCVNRAGWAKTLDQKDTIIQSNEPPVIDIQHKTTYHIPASHCRP